MTHGRLYYLCVPSVRSIVRVAQPHGETIFTGGPETKPTLRDRAEMQVQVQVPALLELSPAWSRECGEFQGVQGQRQPTE